MIRFLPDTWLDAVMRPISMAAPNAGVYVEIMAPDLRFAAILLISIVALAMSRRRAESGRSATVALCAWLAAAFIIWLSTSGNGRYFIPGLLIAGPVCIALVQQLPATRAFRLTLAILVVTLQALAVYTNNPLRAWSLASWNEAPFFGLTLDEQARSVPATYVTLSSISYSLVAPLFPPSSRWVNISTQPDASERSPDVDRVQKLLAESHSIKLLVPTQPDYVTPDGMPDSRLREAFNEMLGRQRLALREPLACRMLRSSGLAAEAFRHPQAVRPETLAKVGFWVCTLDYGVQPRSSKQAVDPEVLRLFDIVERKCSRFFPSGQRSAVRFDGGWLRAYPESDMKLYVLDSGEVFYKYWRAMNPVSLGTRAHIESGGPLDCSLIRGRSGLPWDRDI